jgi:mono/diheme cytochrome c family protein
LLILALAAMGGAIGCVQDMADQPRYEPLEASDFFDDSAASRQPPIGTIPRGRLNVDEHFYTGRIDGQLATTFPHPVEQAMLERGRERFHIYCTPCHDHTGSGRGMVVQRGFPPPPSFHTDRLREAPVGHFFDVMTNGFGRMYDYSAQLSPEDRWAVAAYIRVLQFSQHAPREALSDEDVNQLTTAAAP